VLARKHQVPGVQVVVRRGGASAALEAGELEHGSARSVTCDAAFPIGSISKSFTATMAMVLVADGDLDLDEPIESYLPTLGKAGGQLTLRQLLSHTGGLASGPSSEEVATASLCRYALDHCHPRNVVLPPGAGFSCSNLGYVLAGHLVESVTGMNWWEATESILLRPLGVTPAFVAAPRRRPPTRIVATGHSVNTLMHRTRPVRPSLSPAEAPAGGLALSAGDLAALGAIHVGAGMPEIMPLAWAEEMRRPVPGAEPFGLSEGWGLGLARFRAGDRVWIGHDGNADGTACYLRIDPQDGWIVAFTSNANTGIGLWQEVAALLVDAGVPLAGGASARPATLPIAAPLDCAGVYYNGDTEYLVAQGDDSRFYLAIDGDMCGLLSFYDDLVFSLCDETAAEQVFDGRFLRDSNTGRTEIIQFGGRLARRRDRSIRWHNQAMSA